MVHVPWVLQTIDYTRIVRNAIEVGVITHLKNADLGGMHTLLLRASIQCIVALLLLPLVARFPELRGELARGVVTAVLLLYLGYALHRHMRVKAA